MKLVALIGATLLALTLACEKGSDCGERECCVSLDDGTQKCQPLAGIGEACHLLSGLSPFEKPELPVKECPCDLHLRCLILDADTSAVLGAEGKCRWLLLS